MKRSAWTWLLCVAACSGREAERSFVPVHDPASPRAPAPEYQPPPNPLAREVEGRPGSHAAAPPSASAAPHHHDHAPSGEHP